MRTHHWVLRRTPYTFTVSTDDGEAANFRFESTDVVMDVVLPDDVVFDPPPWVRQGIEARGWVVVSKPVEAPALTYHGMADWRATADALAAAVEALVRDDNPEASERASKALDDYRIAVTEVEMARAPERPSE